LASHPRAGSTWMRFLVERATGKPCGFEKPDWANVLPHYGENPEQPKSTNRKGVLVKTHSCCRGCWSDAPITERLRLVHNSSLDEQHVEQLHGKAFAKQLHFNGVCLIGSGWTLDRRLKDRRLARQKWRLGQIPCTSTYDRAVLLFRYPLDNIRSNYHYRSEVLGYHVKNWDADNYSFPTERGEAWVEFYNAWAKFAKYRPVLWVLYEDMKLDPVRELRRIVDFLDFPNVSLARLQCAVDSSTMERLKKDSDKFSKTKGFFGSRDVTEAREKLDFPKQLIAHFKSIGMFNITHDFGYEPRLEEFMITAGRVLTNGDDSRIVEL